MTRLLAIADASSLIGLEMAELLSSLEPLFAQLLVPPSVDSEIARTVTKPGWIVTRHPVETIDERIAGAALGPGESVVLALGMELPSHVVIIDERRARRVANELGLRLLGTIGLLAAAKRAGVILELRPCLARLVAAGFHASPDLIREVLIRAGEERSGGE